LQKSIALSTRTSRLLPVLAFLFSVLWTLPGFVQAFQMNGAFCYALDDSFIMMAISKNLAQHGVWGLTAHGFSSTASSPLFVVLLALVDVLAGEQVWMPLLLNLVAMAGLYLWLGQKAKQWGLNVWQTWMLLMGLFLLMPIPVLLYGSMEHIVHTWIACWVLFLALEQRTQTSGWVWFLGGALLAGIRYEGLFEGGILILWLWKQKQWKTGFLLGMGMLVPVCTLGFYSISQGWFFLPNSLVLKGYGMNIQETGHLLGYLASWLSKAANHTHAIVAMLALYLLLPGAKKNQNRDAMGLVLWFSLAHFALARYNHVYRYEAYLMGLAWVVIWKHLSQELKFESSVTLWKKVTKEKVQTLAIFLLLLSPLYRSMDSYVVGTRAMVNIFEQQVQMARFVQTYYNTSSIGALDVGAVAYYSDCKLLDMWGLGDLDFARLKLRNAYVPDSIHALCMEKKMDLAIGYGNDMVHPAWQKTESWVISNNAVCSRDTIDFYAFSEIGRAQLRQNLDHFHRQLPPEVRFFRPVFNQK
jgi:hypothetical protein